MNDQNIIQLYFKRNEKAIYETKRKYGAYCYSIANNILRNHEDSEECVSDTWFKTWNAIPPQKPSRLQSFLARITRNTAIDCYRRQDADKRIKGNMLALFDELEECLPDNDSVEREIEANELRQIINMFLHSLPERECNIFLRRYFYAESTAIIAKRYQLQQSNVLMILSRTRNKLKDYLTREEYL